MTESGTEKSTDRLSTVNLDTEGLPTPTAEIEQERRVAIFDLIEENSFALVERDDVKTPPGPYVLNLAVRDRHLVVSVATEDGDPAVDMHLALSPFRGVVRDYFAICESYFDAIRRLPPHQIEAIDMGRRGVHEEGAALLKERLESRIRIDKPTARRLFTLVCVLHFRG